MHKLAIIGAGPAGIEAAKEAILCGLKVVLIDSDFNSFGGTCLNKGCIPAKYYLNRSKYKTNLKDIYKEKEKMVDRIKVSVLDYLKRNGADIIWGRAEFVSSNTLKVSGSIVSAKNIVVAVGSSPKEIIPVDGKHVIFAESLFSFSELPDNFLIIGAGCVGLEMACLLKNLGKKVLVVEKEKRILPGFDKYLSVRLERILKKRGITIKVSQDISEYNLDDYNMVILSAGRKPNIEGLNCAKIGLFQVTAGWINIDRYLLTNIPGIYACGDITGRKLLAYVAERQGRLAVENILGHIRGEDYLGLAECVFTQPQAAFVGILEEEAKQKNIDYRILKTNFLKFSSADVYSDTDGFIEILVDSRGKIIGAGIISCCASELISIFSLAMRQGITLDQLKNATFIHPTLSEIITGAARG